MDQGSTLQTLCNLNYLLRSSISKDSYTDGGLRLQHGDWAGEEDTNIQHDVHAVTPGDSTQ